MAREGHVRRRVHVSIATLAVCACVLLAACAGSTANADNGRVLQVLAASNVWGSIAAQLGGTRARVQSVVSDPNADPHEYASNTDDARAFALADVVVLNGAGYDDWAQRLLQANPRRGRRVVTVADVLGRKAGDNPHFWYDPAAIPRVADRITAGYKGADPSGGGYFDERRSAFTAALKPYTDRLAEINRKFTGIKVGATENIFVYTAGALGLNLISPPEFMNAVAEGNDPPAEAVATFLDQVNQGQIKVLVYNVQTATAVTTNLKRQAAAHDIPVVGVSETLEPESAKFQEWQLAQLISLENALNSDALIK